MRASRALSEARVAPGVPVYRRRAIKPDANGDYRLGPGNQFILGKEGLEHILNGDVVDQVVRVPGEPSQLRPVLRGGLHTAAGWERLKRSRPEVIHGMNFRSDLDALWYFARELQNGTIVIKIPREFFQKNAAALTLMADVYFTSGYLWKTLFPPQMTQQQILVAIDESLFHPEPGESNGGIRVGYALLDDPFKALKIRVQVTGSQINSAFPTWGQPSTGNNGKPYEHADAIGFPLAESTVFFGDREMPDDKHRFTIFGQESPTLEKLNSVTPPLFFKRPTFQVEDRQIELREAWDESLRAWAKSATEQEIDGLKKYLDDSLVLKDPLGLVMYCYEMLYEGVVPSEGLQVSAALFQNQLDGFKALTAYDASHGTNFAKDYALLYLRSRFLRTGALDTWEAKRFHSAVLRWVLGSDDWQLAWDYMSALAVSPSRIALYADVDLNPHVTEDIAIIGVTEPDVRVAPKHFARFAANQLSINYVSQMAPAEREKFAMAVLSRPLKHFDSLIGDLILQGDASELISFGWYARDLVDILISEPNRLDRDVVRLVFHDYFRMLQSAQARVVLDNLAILSGGRELEFDDTPFSAYWVYTKLKHQRMWLRALVAGTYREFERLATAMGDAKLERYCQSREAQFMKERIPLPESVPSRYRRWKTLAGAPHLTAANMIRTMFPGGVKCR